MAVWSEINYSKLLSDNRFDAEYYDPQVLKYEDAVKSYPGGWMMLADMAELITDGDHLKRNYVQDGVLFLTSENFSEHHINYDSELRIETDYERTLARARSEAEVVYITKTGKWYGKAAVCLSDQPVFNISADVAKIRLKPQYDPYFLACYLNSRIGYSLVRREATGGSRDRIILDKLRSLPIPLVRSNKNEYLEVVKLIDRKYREANTLLSDAEDLLGSALGLMQLDMTPQPFFEQSNINVAKANRLDADYFDPRMQNLINVLSRDGLTIRDVVNLSKRRFESREGVEFQYIEIGDVSNDGIAQSSPIMGEDAPSRATWMVKSGDVITSTVRPIRRLSAIITENQDGYVCSSGFAVLTPKNIEPELLLVYLRIPLVCQLLDLYTTASMYPAISTDDLMSIPISIPDFTIREKVIEKVRQSFSARNEAKRILKVACDMVEQTVLKNNF